MHILKLQLAIQSQKLIQNSDDIPDTHFFIYKSKQFPIKFDFFKIHSKKFAKGQALIHSNKNIYLIDDKSEQIPSLSDESIQNFINYVQHQDTILNNDNVSGINYLAKIYEVNSLIKATEEYIDDHHIEITLPDLLFYQNNPSFDTSHYETVIADNLEDYLEDDRLPKLKVSILYRILEKFHSKSGEKKNGCSKKIADFLFKCLDEHKKEASVLFTFIDIENTRSEHLNRLLTNYSSDFDFHFINSQLVKTLYEMQNEMIVREKQSQARQDELVRSIKDEISQMREEVKRLKEENEKLVGEQKRIEEQHGKELKSMKDEMENMKNENEKKLSDQKQKEESNESELSKMKDEIEKLKSEYDKKLNEQKKK